MSENITNTTNAHSTPHIRPNAAQQVDRPIGAVQISGQVGNNASFQTQSNIQKEAHPISRQATKGDNPITISEQRKKKRHKKDAHNQLGEQIKRALDEGFDVSSLQILLPVRKDLISNCLMDIVSNSRDYPYLPQNRQILPAKKFSGLHGIEKSEYWEAGRCQNGDIHLTAIDLTVLRQRLGIQI